MMMIMTVLLQINHEVVAAVTDGTVTAILHIPGNTAGQWPAICIKYVEGGLSVRRMYGVTPNSAM